MEATRKQFPIKTIIRIRPGNIFLEYTNTSVKIEKENGTTVEFTFDKVLSPSSKQIQVYKNVKDEITRFKEGYNATIFCYGNTGAGKTHTMIGTCKQRGLIYNIMADLLDKDEYGISYLEIYNEKVYDLLEQKEVQLREACGSIIIQGLCTKKVRSMDEFKSIFLEGVENRTTGETKLNKYSSRSHSLLRIQKGEAKLYLVDLAGSENNRKTGNEGIRLMESSNINRSLFVLAKVVNSIINKEIRIPYRDSKLTRLLQDSLGGRSVCCIIANVNDDENCILDTINTLSFANKSKKIVNLGSKTNKKEAVKPKAKEVKEKLVPSKLTFYNKDKGMKVLSNKTNLNIQKKKFNASLSFGSSFYEKPDIQLTPKTKEKSYKAFLKRAMEFEEAGKFKEALDDYKTIQKFNDSLFIESKIETLSNLIKTSRQKPKVCLRVILDILNSGNFVNIKRISCIGDKRAQCIMDFVAGGNFFESLDDLKLIFSDKVVKRIMSSVG